MGLESLRRLLDHRRELGTAAGVLLASFLCVLTLLLHFVIVPAAVRRSIEEESRLVEGSRMMQQWMNPSYKMQFKVWVLSVKNPDAILKGAKPLLSQSGPYVFDKSMHNEVSSSGNGTVSFRRKTLYHFNEADSCATCILGNRVWVPNMIYQKFVEVASRVATKAAATALLAQTPFLEVQVGDLLFNGYKDPFLENFCGVPFVKVVCQSVFDLPDRIGLFYGMNNSYSEGDYTIKDGTSNLRERGEVVLFNGLSSLKKEWWKGEEARRLRGTDGSLFHPFIAKEDTLWTFSSSLCRSLPLTFDSPITYEGIPLYRFRMREEEWDSSAESGFCPGTEKLLFDSQRSSNGSLHCLPRGLMAISSCRKNEPPIVVSLPHFSGAATEVREGVEGLNQTDATRDAIHVDIEPTLGVAFRAQRRIQLNVEFWSGKEIAIPSYHRTQSSSLIPVAIVHDDVEIDAVSLSTVQEELVAPQRAASVASIVLVVGAAVCLLFSLYAWLLWRESPSPCVRVSAVASLPGEGSWRPVREVRPSSYI